ncbi:hypothetical protein BCR36DRAFT_413894 [Piromyces finnis]|uniref:LITAF domain-containing protein n=1 Tax=Piromyces finnis TaxID=1754191 RepID=A0A1Y1V3P0_9FUNG|nr:hypothetical protein BCR36DRAFT_413894 [Piromyces finnis]|eukprot:ORX46584.1 hypothetical protein BCR36DRAFT_413894 [Piromyces finnis]
MENPVDIDINDINNNKYQLIDENILKNDNIENTTKVLLDDNNIDNNDNSVINNISIIVENINDNDSKHKENPSQTSDMEIHENKVIDSNKSNDNPIAENNDYHLTTSHSINSMNNIINSSNIEKESKEQDNNSIKRKKSNTLNIDIINEGRPNSISSFEFKDNLMTNSINQEQSISDYNSCDQVLPLKSKRPSLNFMKHITGFSELSKSKIKNKNSTKDECKADIYTNKKNNNGSIKKVIIRSDSNIIGHFDNVIVKEKKNKNVENNSIDENDINNKRFIKSCDDNPNHTVSFSGTGNIRNNILSTSYIVDNDINSDVSKAYSKSMPTTMNYNENNIMNPDNIDILDQNYEEKRNPEDNMFINSSLNGNINYNDFLFEEEENAENGEQSNINQEQIITDTQNQNKEQKKKVKTNTKNVTFNESECYYIPNIYEIHITEESVLYCNKCKKKEHIEIKREYNKTFWTLFILLLLCGVVFAWIPFLFNRFKYYSFYCKELFLKL